MSAWLQVLVATATISAVEAASDGLARTPMSVHPALRSHMIECPDIRVQSGVCVCVGCIITTIALCWAIKLARALSSRLPCTCDAQARVELLELGWRCWMRGWMC